MYQAARPTSTRVLRVSPQAVVLHPEQSAGVSEEAEGKCSPSSSFRHMEAASDQSLDLPALKPHVNVFCHTELFK